MILDGGGLQLAKIGGGQREKTEGRTTLKSGVGSWAEAVPPRTYRYSLLAGFGFLSDLAQCWTAGSFRLTAP